MTEQLDVEHDSMEALVGKAANEFLDELERGVDPNVDDYARRYPEIAGVLREVLGVLEAVRSPNDDCGEALGGQPGTPGGLGRLGDFHVLREIGRGGMGIVYEAEQISLGRRVALKVLPAAAAMDAKRLQRFRNEAQAAAHLHHPNIVPVHAVGCVGSMHYYAMQYIEGHTLAQLVYELRRLEGRDAGTQTPETTTPLARELASGLTAGDRAATHAPRAPEAEMTGNATTPYACDPVRPAGDPPARPAGNDPARSGASSSVLPSDSSASSRAFFRNVARLGTQAADALEHAHGMGVVHRDIKPGNLLLDARGNLWITDFGLAHVHGDTQLTTTGDIIGTLRYMSPEQALAKRGLLDQRTDIYSLGVTLYELATLEPAFQTNDRHELLRMIAFEDPRAPRKVNRSIPRDLETIVLKAIAKDPSGRYTTAQEMADDLRRFLADEPIHARRPTVLQKTAKWCRRHRAVVSTAAALAAVSVVAVAAVALRGQYREEVQHAQAEVQRKRAEQRFELAWSAVDDMYVHAQKLLQYEPRMTELQSALLSKALDFYEGVAREPANDPQARFKRAQALHRIAEIQCRQGSSASEGTGMAEATATAQKLLVRSAQSAQEAIAQLEPLVAQFPEEAAYKNELAETHVLAAYALQGGSGPVVYPVDQQREEAAIASYRAASRCFESLARARPSEAAKYRALLGECELGVAGLQERHAPPELAAEEQTLSRALSLFQGLVDNEPKNVEYRNSLASVYRRRGEVLFAMGRPAEAEPVLRTAAKILDQLSIKFELFPESGYDVAQTYCALGEMLFNTGHYDEAQRDFKKAVDAGEKLVAFYPQVPRYHYGLSTALDGLARTRHMQQQISGARDLEKRALLHARAAHEATRDNFVYRLGIQGYCHRLGLLLVDLGNFREAADAAAGASDIVPTCPFGAERAAEVYSGCVDLVNRDSQLSAQERKTLVDAYVKRLPSLLERIRTNGGYDPGLQNVLAWRLATFPDARVLNPARAVAIAQRVVKWDGKTESNNPDFWNTLGVARYRNRDWKGAIAALQKAVALKKAGDATDDFFLAMAHWQLGERSKARTLYDAAVAQMKDPSTVTLELRRFRDEAEALIKSTQAASASNAAKKE